MNKLIEKIIKEKRKVYFVSPHLDDAILSAGDLIAYLSDKTDVTVINVFTAASSGRSTFSALRLIQKCGFKNVEDFYSFRRDEDKHVIQSTGAKQINLGFIDGMWRKVESPNFVQKLLSYILPEFIHTYPTYRFHLKTRNISKHDHTLLYNLFNKLSKVIEKNAVVFCPLSLGNHVDHVCVRVACEQLGNQLYYWTDYPYVLEASTKELEGLPIPSNRFSFTHDLARKERSIRGYASQLNILFKNDKIDLYSEVYYYSQTMVSAPTITVGIPAHNEEGSIAPLIKSILRQIDYLGHSIVTSIIVASDNSTDRTCAIVRDIAQKQPQVELIDGKNRLGKPGRINQIFTSCKSDYVVIFDADIILKNNLVVQELIKPMQLNNKVVLTSGTSAPQEPKNYAEDIAMAGFSFWDYARSITKHADMYFCEGPIRAFSKSLYKKLRIPNSIAEDVYPYLYVKQHGLGFARAPLAEIRYQLPSTLSDYITQMTRAINTESAQQNHFDATFLSKHYVIGYRSKLLSIAYNLLCNPLWTIGYLIVIGWPKLRSLFTHFNDSGTWHIVESTKAHE